MLAARRLGGRALALVAVALLSACGFHLQGGRTLPEPLSRVFIDSLQPYSVADPAVETALRARLRRRGGEVTGSRRDAVSVLELRSVETESRTLSVGPDGRSIEVEIVVTATYSLRQGSELLVAPETITARRPLSFPSEEILPKEAEERRLADFLQEEVADLILLQLEVRLRE